MADERRDDGRADESRLRRRLRFVSGIVILGLVVLLVVVDTFGRLLVDRDFRVSDLFLGTLTGALLLLLGIEGITRLPGGRS